jgi:pimeloyl-ACP methyl ester carboxylesterase
MAVMTAGSSAAAAKGQYTTGSVVSKDGTTIGYRQFGHGPGVVLVQGTMGTAQHFLQLAQALADTFTAYTPDRRGRGISDPGGGDYSTQKDVEDLDALLRKTDAHYVFGLSSGAIISLKAALSLPDIRKLAIYEPPLFIYGVPTALVARYEKEMAQENVPAALVTAMKAAQMGPPIFNLIPRRLIESLVNMGIKAEEKKGSGDYPSMRELASTLRYDFKVVSEMSGALESFRAINPDNTEVLLLGGSQSPKYLKAALDALEKVLPRAKRVEFPGLGHAASWNTDKGGKPEPVAQALRRFFA